VLDSIAPHRKPLLIIGRRPSRRALATLVCEPPARCAPQSGCLNPRLRWIAASHAAKTSPFSPMVSLITRTPVSSCENTKLEIARSCPRASPSTKDNHTHRWPMQQVAVKARVEADPQADRRNRTPPTTKRKLRTPGQKLSVGVARVVLGACHRKTRMQDKKLRLGSMPHATKAGCLGGHASQAAHHPLLTLAPALEDVRRLAISPVRAIGATIVASALSAPLMRYRPRTPGVNGASLASTQGMALQ